MSGKQFQRATLQLTEAGGSLTVDLFQAPIKKSGPKNGTIKSQVLIRNATGDYTDAAGGAGSFVVTIKQLQKRYKK